MSSGTIRQVWSDAELDEALATLHSGPGVRQDELSRTRAALLRAAGDVDDDLLPVTEPDRPAKKRPGSWRWIAAAAAAALVPGAVIVGANVFVVGDSQDTAAHAAHITDDELLSSLRGTDIALRDGQYRLVTDSTWATRYGKDESVIYQTHEIIEKWNPSDPQKPAKLRFTRTGEIRWLKGDYETAKAHGELIPGATSDVMYGFGETPPLPTGGVAIGTAGPPPPSLAPPTTTTTNPNRQELPAGTTPPPLQPPRSESSRNDGRWDGGWAKPSPQFLAGLPTDPAQLLERLRRDDGIRAAGPSSPGQVNSAQEIFEMAYSALRAGYGFGDLRVALCKALAQVPGITLKQDATTADGRRGLSFSVQLTDQTREIIVAPETATVIANRAIATAKPLPAGAALFETTTTVAVTDKNGP